MQKKFLLIFSALVLVFGFYGVFYAQKIPIAEGKGWDGALYVEYVQQWPDPILKKELPPYYLKRTLLPAMLHYACSVQATIQGITVQQIPEATILRYFDCFNMICLCLIFFLLYKIFIKVFAERFTSQPWWIMLWAGMNVYIMKMTFYYPALLDTFACMLGALMLYGHLNRKNYWILIAMAAGYFTHPLLFVMGAVLLLWPEAITFKRSIHSIVVWIIISLFAALFSYWLYDSYVFYPDGVRPVEERWIWLSALCTVTYLSYVLYTSALIRDGINYLFQLRWLNLIPVAILYTLLSWIVESFRNEQPGWKLSDFLHTTGYDSMQDPFIFIVAHVVYFGPGTLVLFIFADQWKEWLRQQTGGLQLVIWMMFVLMVNNESRQLIVFWPFALLLIIKIVSEWKHNYIRYIVALILIIASRFWLDMHTFANGDYFEFPAQYYFMHMGPWMSVDNYNWQAAVAFFMGVLIFRYKKELDKNEENNLAS